MDAVFTAANVAGLATNVGAIYVALIAVTLISVGASWARRALRGR